MLVGENLGESFIIIIFFKDPVPGYNPSSFFFFLFNVRRIVKITISYLLVFSVLLFDLIYLQFFISPSLLLGILADYVFFFKYIHSVNKSTSQ